MPKFIPLGSIRAKDAAHFHARVDTRAGVDACWPWKFGQDGAGYGRVKLNGIAYRAHRVAYFLATGQDPAENLVCHRCDFPLCCNPNHLFAGDHDLNMADMAQKGRARGGSPPGENAHNAKLTADNLEKILAMIRGGSTNVAIGRVFGVTHQAISRIRRGRAWGNSPIQEPYASLKGRKV